MAAASRGSVLVEERPADASALRGRLGLCPQHNLFFPDLTVIEHLIFFAMLKGLSYRKAKKESRNLLELLKLQEKASKKGEQLSGGMKRRLQLACALAGGAPLLVLDEPTAGLDVETRRELWDTLLSLRGARTVLMTTHMMEEADALADRVAALHAGQLCANATPMFLKKAVGTGYRLSLTVTEGADEVTVANAIRSIVPEAELRERTPTSLTYGLPAECSASFPGLFDMLEKNKSRLGISTIGVGSPFRLKLELRLEVKSKLTIQNGNENEVFSRDRNGSGSGRDVEMGRKMKCLAATGMGAGAREMSNEIRVRIETIQNGNENEVFSPDRNGSGSGEMLSEIRVRIDNTEWEGK
ncbi:ATP-binding cassette sub-family A member 3 [Eumeta japonica]|uniref:ATP-binding cassette sub-family A member 3 n=1 Tax=Eumeta variegata TaxID=151549 RepID=A0A4C1XIU0_EUMVA|nr:ATP-binding cassette sub-family A member 3 [Eumeta japonica]